MSPDVPKMSVVEAVNALRDMPLSGKHRCAIKCLQYWALFNEESYGRPPVAYMGPQPYISQEAAVKALKDIRNAVRNVKPNLITVATVTEMIEQINRALDVAAMPVLNCMTCSVALRGESGPYCSNCKPNMQDLDDFDAQTDRLRSVSIALGLLSESGRDTVSVDAVSKYLRFIETGNVNA